MTHEALGEVCSPLHAVMNAGFILLGVQIVPGAFLARGAWPRRRLTTSGLVLVSLGGPGGTGPLPPPGPAYLTGARYPTPRTVSRSFGLLGSRSIFSRSQRTWTSTVRMSPTCP